VRLSDEPTAKFEIELVNKQVQKIKQAKKDCQTHYGKQLGCGTCKALQLCIWIDELVDTIEAMRKHIESSQQENEQLRAKLENWKHEVQCHMDEVVARDKEIEKLRTYVARMRSGKMVNNFKIGDKVRFRHHLPEPYKEDCYMDLKSLEKTCPKCRGYRIIEHPDWTKYWQEHTEVIPEKTPKVKQGLICPKCNGRGTVLTPKGLELINFIKKYVTF
jgi:predicted RNase H-like nuclease (RuvC/YqgF family)